MDKSEGLVDRYCRRTCGKSRRSTCFARQDSWTVPGARRAASLVTHTRTLRPFGTFPPFASRDSGKAETSLRRAARVDDSVLYGLAFSKAGSSGSGQSMKALGPSPSRNQTFGPGATRGRRLEFSNGATMIKLSLAFRGLQVLFQIDAETLVLILLLARFAQGHL